MFCPRRLFWGTDITKMPCSWRQCVTHFQEIDLDSGSRHEAHDGRGNLRLDWLEAVTGYQVSETQGTFPSLCVHRPIAAVLGHSKIALTVTTDLVHLYENPILYKVRTFR